MMLSEELLQEARSTLERPELSQAALRRAASTAYYALFHRIIAEAGRLLATEENQALGALVGRAFSHNDMKRACKSFVGKPLPQELLLFWPDGSPIPPALRTVATTFIKVQEIRHQADYQVNQAFVFEGEGNQGPAVSNLVGLVAKAFSAWDDLCRDDPRAARIFLLALLLGKHWKRD